MHGFEDGDWEDVEYGSVFSLNGWPHAVYLGNPASSIQHLEIISCYCYCRIGLQLTVATENKYILKFFSLSSLAKKKYSKDFFTFDST